MQSAIDWLSSHVLQLVESGLHGVHIVGLSGGGIGLGCCGLNLAFCRINLTTGLHGLLVTHLGKEIHDLTIVD